MILKFNTNGNSKQKEAVKSWLDDSVTDIVYGGSKGSGKSYLGCSMIFGDAFIYPQTHYFIARKNLNDLRKYTRPSIHEVFDHWGINDNHWKYNGQDNFYELHNGSQVFLLDAKHLPSDPTYARFGSMQMTRGWIEEAGEFQESARNNLFASLGRKNNEKYNLQKKLLQTCNPAKNYLYRDYYLPHKEGDLVSWRKFLQALPSDNKMLPKSYIEDLLLILTPNEVQRLLYGNWEYDDNPNAIFDYEDILGMFTNEFVVAGRDRYITADIAYEGSDLFVIGVWHGFELVKIYAFDKVDETQVARKMHEIRVRHKVPVKNLVYDADGLKKFVRQSGKTGYLKGAKEFYNNGKPFKVNGQLENFKNIKAQCYFELARKVSASEIYISDKDYRKQIIQEAEQINKLPLSDDGKQAMEKKDDLKKRLGRSPDFMDMMMMRMFFEVSPKRVKVY